MLFSQWIAFALGTMLELFLVPLRFLIGQGTFDFLNATLP